MTILHGPIDGLQVGVGHIKNSHHPRRGKFFCLTSQTLLNSFTYAVIVLPCLCLLISNDNKISYSLEDKLYRPWDAPFVMA